MASKKTISSSSSSWFLIIFLIALFLLSSSSPPSSPLEQDQEQEQKQDLVAEAAARTGTGECGKTPIKSAAMSLSPCLSAAGNPKINVPANCCAKVGALIKSDPRCLCAVLLSPLAKQAGIKPAIAIGIPKRCNIRNRPIGKKCGPYIVP